MTKSIDGIILKSINEKREEIEERLRRIVEISQNILGISQKKGDEIWITTTCGEENYKVGLAEDNRNNVIIAMYHRKKNGETLDLVVKQPNPNKETNGDAIIYSLRRNSTIYEKHRGRDTYLELTPENIAENEVDNRLREVGVSIRRYVLIERVRKVRLRVQTGNIGNIGGIGFEVIDNPCYCTNKEVKETLSRIGILDGCLSEAYNNILQQFGGNYEEPQDSVTENS